MAGNSLESVLAWMKTDSRLLGWGFIVALERRKANLLIIQEYIRRFSAESYLPAITGDVPITDNREIEQIYDFLLDVPRLSFENADLNDSKALLTMAVIGGSQVSLLLDDGFGWAPYKLDEIDPLQGPKLYLDLLLNQVPGDVETDGRIKLDLSKSDNFRLTFGETDHQQRMGGDFFKDLFKQLPDEKRIYPLGQIQRGTNELMDPKSFELRTQASSAASRDSRSTEHGNGAILALVRTTSRNGGNFPGASYKYLIPDDVGKDYSATMLLDLKQVLMSAIMSEMEGLLESASYDYESDGSALLRATATSGQMVFPKIEFSQEFEHPWDGTMLNVAVNLDPLIYSASGTKPLIVEAFNDKVVVRWDSVTEVKGVIDPLDGPVKEFVLQCAFTFRTEYELVAGVDGNLELVRGDYDFKFDSKEVKTAFVGTTHNAWWEAFMEFFLPLLVLQILPYLYISVAFVAMWDGAFKKVFSPVRSINAIIDETLKLNFGQAIQGTELYAPADIGFFGRINPTQTSFSVSPMEPMLKQGGTLKFTTDPVVPGVQWKVENLVEGPGKPGEINKDTGLYQAPPAASIDGRYTRVRVTATAPATGYFSSALVTVVVNEITVNPLIQVSKPGVPVELSAGQLGTDALSWSIKNPVAGSGRLVPSDKPGGDHTYLPGPEVAKTTYILDEIEVKSASGATRSTYVLATKKKIISTIFIHSIDTAKREVQLKVDFNGEIYDPEWILPLQGRGSIDATGLYKASPATTERFDLIFAKLDGGITGPIEAYFILPLPLVEFPPLPAIPEPLLSIETRV